MNELEKIKYMEYYFPKMFADMEQRDFGVMFYNIENFDSNDSNHAIITNESDIQAAVQKIKTFYLSKNLKPRIYSSLEEGQLNKLRDILVTNGFKINDYGYTDYLVYSGNSEITEPYSLDFQRFMADSDYSIFSQLVENEAVFRTQEVIRCRVDNPDYYLYIGYEDDFPAVMASFQFDEHMTARLDEVETSECHRGKGYARQIIRYLTNVFDKKDGKLFFTWAANDTAQRVYLQGGFQVKYRFPAWSAYIEIDNMGDTI